MPTEINLKYTCTAPNNKCVYTDNDCIEEIDNEQWICPHLKATRSQTQ